MNNYIFLEGAALWVFLALIILVLLAVIVLGIEHIKALKKVYELTVENDKLLQNNDKLEDKLYRLSYRTPEV